MRVLVTGATGFIGQVLVRHLSAQGHEPIIVVREGGDRPNAIRWDLGEAPPPASLPRQIDGIVHAAQSRNYRGFPGDARELFAVNTASTLKLLDYAVKAEASRFCLLSSGTIYEPFVRGFDEDAPLAPTSMLGATKLAAEIVARAFDKLFPVSILRIFSPYGPGQTARLIPDLIRRVREGAAIQLTADGHGARFAPIYVDDVCSIIVTSLVEEWRGVMNLAAPQAATIREMSEMIGNLLGKSPTFEVGAGTVLDLVPPVRKLSARVDLSKLVPLLEGLARTVAGAR